MPLNSSAVAPSSAWGQASRSRSSGAPPAASAASGARGAPTSSARRRPGQRRQRRGGGGAGGVAGERGLHAEVGDASPARALIRERFERRRQCWWRQRRGRGADAFGVAGRRARRVRRAGRLGLLLRAAAPQHDGGEARAARTEAAQRAGRPPLGSAGRVHAEHDAPSREAPDRGARRAAGEAQALARGWVQLLFHLGVGNRLCQWPAFQAFRARRTGASSARGSSCCGDAGDRMRSCM
ncbi:MAG: hypothetical protein J3K34DRAFT_258717 [Monoraphidium minutum]|nr:MAG: hypothetical protein J3K34DRAFT_258717 [Monoraphidium minutum]